MYAGTSFLMLDMLKALPDDIMLSGRKRVIICNPYSLARIVEEVPSI